MITTVIRIDASAHSGPLLRLEVVCASCLPIMNQVYAHTKPMIQLDWRKTIRVSNLEGSVAAGVL